MEGGWRRTILKTVEAGCTEGMGNSIFNRTSILYKSIHRSEMFILPALLLQLPSTPWTTAETPL